VKTIINREHFGALAYGTPGSGFAGIPIHLQDREWPTDAWQSNYEGHGVLSNLYLGPDDNKSYFHESDTPSFLHILPVGLRSTGSPTDGGWGGRLSGPSRDGVHWTDANVAEQNYQSKSLTYWFEGSESDYAVRHDWTNTSSFSAANHPPVAALGHAQDLSKSAGSVVNLSAEGSFDLDGDGLSYKWYQYPEADSCSGTVTINNAASKNASFAFSGGASGKEVHVILEIKDNGSPALIRYRRVIITGR